MPFLQCCKRAGDDGLDPEVRRQWMQLAAAWRSAERQAEAFELAEKLAQQK
jgi:hypothetical protein